MLVLPSSLRLGIKEIGSRMKPLVALCAVLLIGSSLARAQSGAPGGDPHAGHDHGPGGHEHGGPPPGPSGSPIPPPTMEPPSLGERTLLEKLSGLKQNAPKNAEEEKKLRGEYAEGLQELVDKFPDSPRTPFALEALLKLHVQTGNPEKAEAVAKGFVAKAKSPGARSFGAKQVVAVYRHSGQPGKAVTYATEKATAEPDSPDVEWFLYEAANIQAERGKFDDAIALLANFLAKHANHPAAARFQLRSADLLISAGKPAEARKALEAVQKAKLVPQDQSMATHLVATSYLAESRQATGEAAAALRKKALDTIQPVLDATRKDPSSPEPYGATAFTTAADVALAAGDVQGAIKVYEEMARLFKDKPAGNYAERSARDVAFIGTAIEDVNGPDAVSGKPVDAKSFRGKILLVDFWSFAFPDYLSDLATYQRLNEKLAGKPFQVIGVNLDKKEQSEQVKQFLASQKIAWPVIMDGKGTASPIAVMHGISGPSSFVVDEDGVILRVALRGPHLEDLVTQEVARVAKGQPSPMKSRAKASPQK